MKIIFLLFVCSFFNRSIAYGQDGVEYLDSASASFCNRDTLKTINYLERFSKLETKTNLHTLVKLRLGQLYQSSGRMALALANYVDGLETPWDTYIYKDFKYNDNQSPKLFYILNSETKAEICLQLSNIYKSTNDFDKSYDYLILADTKYFPQYGCGTAAYMYKTKLAIRLANFYLDQSDTTKAIEKLLDFILMGYSEPMAIQLKQLLYTKYTATYIKKEINNGIKYLRKIKYMSNGQSYNRFELVLFGHKLLWCCQYDELKNNKIFLKNHHVIKMLLNNDCYDLPISLNYTTPQTDKSPVPHADPE